jgi:hypothetical protein
MAIKIRSNKDKRRVKKYRPAMRTRMLNYQSPARGEFERNKKVVKNE